MNGLPADIPLTMAPLGNPEVIKVLEQALAEACAGRLAAVALIMVPRPGQVTTVAAGGSRTDINLGLDMLKAAILAQAQGGGGGGSYKFLLHARR